MLWETPSLLEEYFPCSRKPHFNPQIKFQTTGKYKLLHQLVWRPCKKEERRKKKEIERKKKEEAGKEERNREKEERRSWEM
ncbi:hypothetical protein EO98_15435 [Methanosarcina sp. 2.H.T.1A.6]|nr:hypothetical protein EO98_15435 [Methanosarcina sp. 2.H.T.1A.6]KKG24378.1 hypothetical protein EO96_14430 [Methanosarcina sp. 2.H.T.1A.8]